MNIDFNRPQLEAVKHVCGPMMVLAGPGSGKTAVITGRLENLILNEKIPAEKILAVTFSKKAALEMERRFKENVALKGPGPAFGTFHSIFYSVLRQNGGENLKVISEKQKYTAVRICMESLEFEFESSEDFFGQVLGEISAVKTNALDINGCASGTLPGDIFKYVYKKYNEYLCANGLIDFDDMLAGTLRLFCRNGAALAAQQEKYPFILIDEFQDINLLQYEIMRLLAQKERNIFVVGDDDQSIYGFRGARPELMKRFFKDFKGAGQILLDINYRSTAQIVSAAGRVISGNEGRFPKKIRPAKGKSGPEVNVLSFPDERAQADQIIQKIRTLKEGGTPPGEIAVLFRNNADMGYISKRLSDAGLAVCRRENAHGLYGHFISRDITAYIRASLDYPSCALPDILLIMNRPSRYISRRALSYGEYPFSSMKAFYKNNSRMCAAIKKFESDLRFLSTLPPLSAVKYIRRAIGYDAYIKEYAQRSKTDICEYDEVFKKLENDASGFASLFLWQGFINEEAGKYDTAQRQVPALSRRKEAEGEGLVNIMTIHASKGLEWDAVFIPDCCDSIIPGKNAALLSGLEEERRVLYVAMTRARAFLQISCPGKIHGKNADFSRFLKKIAD